jgi:hypothetical protein
VRRNPAFHPEERMAAFVDRSKLLFEDAANSRSAQVEQTERIDALLQNLPE